MTTHNVLDVKKRMILIMGHGRKREIRDTRFIQTFKNTYKEKRNE